MLSLPISCECARDHFFWRGFLKFGQSLFKQVFVLSGNPRPQPAQYQRYTSEEEEEAAGPNTTCFWLKQRGLKKKQKRVKKRINMLPEFTETRYLFKAKFSLTFFEGVAR
jgi:hypothetical protein